MSELPEGVAPARTPEPRDSASAVVLRREAATWQVLLGLRSRRARFLPGHHSCPGGGLEPSDEPDRDGAFERCARRELLEETGIDAGAGSWFPAGTRITPAMFPIRFHTRFFVTALPEGVRPTELEPTTTENESLRLVGPSEILDEWARGRARLPPPILPLLRVIAGSSDGSLEQIARRIAEANSREERTPRIEFTPDVWMLPVRTATLPPATHTNVWMPGGRRFAVLDPGSAEPREQRRLLEVIERRRASGAEPSAVILTHHHQDHSAGAAAAAEALGVPLCAHAATFDALGLRPDAGRCDLLEDGQRIDLAGMTLRALHTPGHAAGHLAFEIEDRGLLIAGDLLSGLSTILIDPTHGDMDAYLRSLERAEAAGCRMLLPGHGPPLPAKRLAALVAHRLERERRILEAVRADEPDLPAIARAAYADTPGLPVGLTESQTLAHLLRLERLGEVVGEAPGRRWRLSGGAT